MTSNTYEYEMDRLLSAGGPDYYTTLKEAISEFEDALIRSSIIPDNSFKSYVQLLHEIEKGYEFKLETAFDPDGTLEKMGFVLESVMLSSEGIMIATKYLNIDTSKSFRLNLKVSELIDDGQLLSRSRVAGLYLEVYDALDFEFPLIKSKICKFLDPNTDSIIHIYVDKPKGE
ncbi:hypothetical protein SAMN06265375_10146 [Muriicola jejuensis]|uniref:Uncharacterized protein n=1 Tax=Muriicola jejuensis TaxID=504488 RepID=A0A6P0UEU9_9FLAO|nr:hypothetical protein [Muriicola jejuensis]NER10409.1 hypothetical protein [Muriicola jejuensis]SMP00918.1 hypothetical protein SAMN06265375_10146 [Muriicola jejuensis]